MKKISFPFPDQSYFLKKKSISGFTLVEILIAFVILTTAVIGLSSSFVASHKYVKRSRHRLAAVNLARTILEDLKAHVRQDTWTDDTSNLLACPGASYPCTKNYNLPVMYPFNLPLGWSATYFIEQPPALDINGMQMRQVTVNIHWDEPT